MKNIDEKKMEQHWGHKNKMVARSNNQLKKMPIERKNSKLKIKEFYHL